MPASHGFDLHHDSKLMELIAETREQVRRAADLLREPPPDTFMGRRTCEPFPKDTQISLRDGNSNPPGVVTTE